MRRPSDVPPPAARINPRGHRRLRIWIIVAIVVIIVLLASLRTLATFYTDYLWFGSVHQPAVWRGILGVKLSLFLVFAAVFFVVLWVNLAIVDRMTPSMLTLGPEDELVRRYQHIVTPRAFLVRTIVSIVIALIAASSTIGQWQNWLLYVHAVPFGVKDPEFHKDISFFVFKLPFIQFVIGWVFASLVVITIITAVAHYLNGGIRPQGRPPRVAPQVKVHLSVLVAVIAVVKAVGYYYQRFTLDFSSNGYVQGAAYTDVHARLPAISMLFWISLLAAVILLVNIRSRGWLLPVLAVGLWAFVAIVVGAIYPAVVQALKVTPAQSTLELPYIQRNIQATQAAYNLTSSNVTQESYAATQSLTSSEEQSNAATFSDIRLWDPESSLTGATYAKLQQERSFFQFNTQALDRYEVNGTVTPTIVAVRQVNSSNLPAQGWVNSHLEYTHGYGMIASPANVQTSSGTPSFSPGIQNVPPTSDSYPSITQPDVYFGVNSPGYVIADTKQAEIDYQDANGQNHYSTYSGTGGVQLNSFLKRAAFAIRFGDLNVLISDLITPDSRMMFVRDIQAEVNKVAPFLSLDSDPYPVIVNGDIDWVQDAYTTTGNYPYAQDADTSAVSSNSGLSGLTFNYIEEFGEGRHQRLHREHDLLRDGSAGPDHQDVDGRLSFAVHPGVTDAGGASRPSALPGGHLHGPDRDVRPLPHRQSGRFLQRRRRVELVGECWGGLADCSTAEHGHDQCPGPERGGSGRADGTDLPSAANPGGTCPEFQHHGGIRSGLAERQCADPCRLCIWRLRLWSRLRKIDGIRNTGGGEHRRARTGRRAHPRQYDRVPENHAAELRGLFCRARESACSAGGRGDPVLPASIRPGQELLPGAPRSHRRVRRSGQQPGLHGADAFPDAFSDLRDDDLADYSYEADAASAEHPTSVRPGAGTYLTGVHALAQDPGRSARRQPRSVPGGCQPAEQGDRPVESADRQIEEGHVDNDHDKSDDHDYNEPDDVHHHINDVDERHDDYLVCRDDQRHVGHQELAEYDDRRGGLSRRSLQIASSVGRVSFACRAGLWRDRHSVVSSRTSPRGGAVW